MLNYVQNLFNNASKVFVPLHPIINFCQLHIYKDKEECCCQSMKLNRIHMTYNHTLQQKLSAMTGYIGFEAPFKYMKEFPHEEYGKKINFW
jgi:hypothetical protein